MATQYENFSVSEVNFTQAEGSDLNDSGLHSIVITPSSGFTVTASDFSLTSPIPTGITNYSFDQSGSNVVLNFEFADNTIMPGNNIEFPLCIQGNASGQLYTIQGNFTINTQNAIPTSESGQYSGSGTFASTTNVLTKTVTANGNFYFFEEPQISLAIGNPNNYTISSNKVYDINANLTSVTFNVSYTFPNQNISGDSIVVQAEAIPIVIPTQYINAFTLNGTSNYNYAANVNGETLTLNLVGDVGAIYSVELVDVYSTTVVYASNVAISSSGTAQITGISIPNYSENKHPYELKITGDINPAIANNGAGVKISIEQDEPVSITVTATSTNPNIDVSGVPDTLMLSPNTAYNPGFLPRLNFSFSAAAIGPFVISQDSSVVSSSFDPAIPDPSATNYIYSLSNLTSTLEEGIFTVSGTIEVSSSGGQLIIHTLDLDQIISTPPVSNFNSVLKVTDCSSTEGVGRPIASIAANAVIVGAELAYLIDETIIPLATGSYRMSNDLADGTTYLINNIPFTYYIVDVVNGNITNIIECQINTP
jgi:hypothetical protein